MMKIEYPIPEWFAGVINPINATMTIDAATPIRKRLKRKRSFLPLRI